MLSLEIKGKDMYYITDTDKRINIYVGRESAYNTPIIECYYNAFYLGKRKEPLTELNPYNIMVLFEILDKVYIDIIFKGYSTNLDISDELYNYFVTMLKEC